ncbi:c-type cytochrome [Crenothrix polyspora]|nr:hypothetical protein [Crenothrix polyspora]
MNRLKSFFSIFWVMLAFFVFSGNANAVVGTYAGDCAVCHGPSGAGTVIAPKAITGGSASKIKSAIVGGVPMMAGLVGLSDTQLNAIAAEIGGAANLSVAPLPVVCTSPAVRDAATNTCKTPACPTGQVRNASGVCAVVPVSCTAPQVRDAASNTCVTPACPTGQVRNASGVCAVVPVSCAAPQVRDAASNTCVTPACPTGQVRNASGVCAVVPVSCAAPQVRDAASNTCVTPACPTGQVRNASGVCAVVPVSCTAPQVRDAVSNTCVTPAVVPVSCTAPKVRDAATNTCVTPAVVPVSCTAPKVRDVATNTCVTPAVVPVSCTAPKVRDAATNTCVTPVVEPVSCTEPEVLDAATNTCVTPVVEPVSCIEPEVLDAATNTCVTPVVEPVSCTEPEVLNVATNACVIPACSVGETMNAEGVCEVIPSVACVLPKMLINGACALTTTSCDDAFKKFEHEQHEAYERAEHGDKAKLVIAVPTTQAIHAEQVLNLGMVVYGDERKIAMGVNLPKGARFTESYNGDLQLHQGMLGWKVPKSASGKTIKIKLCAEAHNEGGYSKKDMKFVFKTVLVKVLPELKSTLVTEPVIGRNVISSAVYNTAMQRLEVSGQVKLSAQKVNAVRKKSGAQLIQLSNAHNAALLGAVKAKADGKWFVAIPLSSALMPRVIDATFNGKVVTVMVKKLP